ncbi:hypothetical protein [Dactylosporangium matsuzakiense]|uniref:Uncharacterized protein n=1 Tax=Dactylosporangium matsuzakiense TaxID=53360 RepID=A0A9W6KUJ4_9ACTN|nr:hypothetical protein [Dactylosporangium matsuzakiense]GLL08327.1 hypothetical protein GCM10017581_100880 [Dactylosporangium matsuzakiense]
MPTHRSQPHRQPSNRGWPTTPLDAAQRAFDLLVCPPAPLTFDGREIPGLPDRHLPLAELKRLLIDDATSRPVRDAVWRELVVRARRDGPAWVIAAVGIAMPGLRRAAGMLAKGWPGDSSDRDSELLTGFLDRLRSIDLGDSRIAGKLIDAGARAVKAAREREAATDMIRVQAAWSLPPQQPWDHPDWVLTRAVAQAVIDQDDYLLIAETRLEHAALATVADRLGVSVALAAAWRRKAEQRLAAAIRAGELDWVPLVPLAQGTPGRRTGGVLPMDDLLAGVRSEPAAVALTAAGRAVA